MILCNYDDDEDDGYQGEGVWQGGGGGGRRPVILKVTSSSPPPRCGGAATWRAPLSLSFAEQFKLCSI